MDNIININVATYVGDVIDLDYEFAYVQINEEKKSFVNGIPNNSFLLACRSNEEPIILLKVIGSFKLPNDIDRARIKIEQAEKNDEGTSLWDQQLDPLTRDFLGYSALKCRIIGTFFNNNESKSIFGSDIPGFYPSRALCVYKATDDVLYNIINYGLNPDESVRIGKLRYTSTQINDEEQEVLISPHDLVSRKTAVFGMTRTGKSNTIKIIAKAIYQLRFEDNSSKIGQLIFDPNGEYANPNFQDASPEEKEKNENQSLSNVWKIPVKNKIGNINDVLIYTSNEHEYNKAKKDSKENYRIMKINFYDDKNLNEGKLLINNFLILDGNKSQFIKNFIQVSFDEDIDPNNRSALNRNLKKVLAYKTLLSKLGFQPQYQGILTTTIDKIFSKEFVNALETCTNNDKNPNKSEILSALNFIKELKINAKNEKDEKKQSSPVEFSKCTRIFTGTAHFLKSEEYIQFNEEYIKTSSTGEAWADSDLESILAMFLNNIGTKRIADAKKFHSKDSSEDYVYNIYQALKAGNIVIIDQASTESSINKASAERLINYIFQNNLQMFTEGKKPNNIVIYVEEAHNLMPKGSETDNSNIWAKVAKEGAKLHIGMVYSTQEVSSIQKSILKNTNNWFIAHLNNKEEIRTLSDFYDFEDYSIATLRNEDPGFLRIKTLSNKYVIPVQIDVFQLNQDKKE